MCSKWDNDPVVRRFQEYLRIPSVHPDVDYGDCVKFIKNQGKELGLLIAVHEIVPKKPVVVLTWTGSQPELPAILLNSHMDVVPVYEEFWTYPPFEAKISEDGYIYARGSQDMKSIGMMHLESVRRLKNAGIKLKRTVHLSFVPDEETGGVDGMKIFSESNEFKKLNIGFSLDESMTSLENKQLLAFNGERTSRAVRVTCKGEPAHGSLLTRNSAGEKLSYIIDKFMKLREVEMKKFETGTQLGNVTTINLTQLEGGVQVNVLPESLSVSFDIRIAPDVDHDEFEKMMKTWCEEAGENVTFEYYVKNQPAVITKIDETVPFWGALKDAVNRMDMDINCVICPGCTDARYIRLQGIPAIGLSPILNTERLLHAHNEKIHVDVFKKGIDIMEKVVLAVANV